MTTPAAVPMRRLQGAPSFVQRVSLASVDATRVAFQRENTVAHVLKHAARCTLHGSMPQGRRGRRVTAPPNGLSQHTCSVGASKAPRSTDQRSPAGRRVANLGQMRDARNAVSSSKECAWRHTDRSARESARQSPGHDVGLDLPSPVPPCPVPAGRQAPHCTGLGHRDTMPGGGTAATTGEHARLSMTRSPCFNPAALPQTSSSGEPRHRLLSPLMASSLPGSRSSFHVSERVSEPRCDRRLFCRVRASTHFFCFWL